MAVDLAEVWAPGLSRHLIMRASGSRPDRLTPRRRRG
jgi:hypothetical protein